MIAKKSSQSVTLKSKYPLVLKESLVFILTLFVIIMYFNPVLSNRTANNKTNSTLPDIILPRVIKHINPLKADRPTIPKIPVKGDESIELDVDFEPISEAQIAELINWNPIPEINDAGERMPEIEFVPYTKEPFPIGGFHAVQKKVIYPEIAREAGLQGQVYVRAFIKKDGNVGECRIIKGVEGLNEAAIAAVKKTRFSPAMQRDKPVGVWISIPIIFKLN